MKSLFFTVLFLIFMSPSSFGATQELKEETHNVIHEIAEFQLLAELSKRHKIPIYLFGGTAASVVSFAKVKLNKKGLLEDRLLPYFSNVISPLKDLDIVIDGPASLIEQIKNEVISKYPLYMPNGDKSKWEFRPLRYGAHGKDALFNNPELQNQHSDSASLTLISVTPKIAPSIHLGAKELPDLFDSIASGTVNYFFSSTHQNTLRYQLGLNPPIISAVRILIKSLEFGLQIRKEDSLIIKKIINEFEPENLSGYARSWLERNSIKLILSAQDINKAFEIINHLGLRDKLKSLGNPMLQGSLSWWMHKEPLPALPLGSKGQTAGSLGYTHVAHSTTSSFYYQILSGSFNGSPNAFQSRENTLGERAVHGNGFYVALGKKGAWSKQGDSSAYDLVYKLHPLARKGSDFEVINAQAGNWLLIKNSNAITRESSSINVSLRDQVFSILGLDNNSNNHNSLSSEFFKSIKGHIAKKMTQASGEIRAKIEKEALTHLNFKNHTIIQFFNLTGGLSKTGQHYLIKILIDNAERGNIHSAIPPKLTPLFSKGEFSKEIEEQIYETITSNSKNLWAQGLYPVLPFLSKPLQERFLNSKRAETINPIIQSKGKLEIHLANFHSFLRLAKYLPLTDKELLGFEEKLWNETSSQSHATTYWQELLLDMNNKDQLNKILHKRINNILNLMVTEPISHAFIELFMTSGDNELIEKFLSRFEKNIKDGLQKKEGNTYLIEKMNHLYSVYNIRFDFKPIEYFQIAFNLHLNPTNRIAEQSFDDGHSITHISTQNTPFDHLYEWANEKSINERQKKGIVDLFKLWVSKIDIYSAPGIALAKNFGRIIEKTDIANHNIFKNYLIGLIQAATSRTWSRSSRFEGDYSVQRNIGLLLIDTEMTLNFPETLNFVHGLATTRMNYDIEPPQPEVEPSLYIVLQHIINNKTPSDFLAVFKNLYFSSQAHTDPLIDELISNYLYTPYFLDRPDIIFNVMQVVNQIKHGYATRDSWTESFINAYEKAAEKERVRMSAPSCKKTLSL